jgi:hypothetical protein
MNHHDHEGHGLGERRAIVPGAQDHERDKELKVKVPLSLHLKLHTMKLMRGQPISDTVRIALQRYFEEQPWQAARAPAQAEPPAWVEALAPALDMPSLPPYVPLDDEADAV